MADTTIYAVEQQVKDHGFSITTTVERNGVAVVSLKRTAYGLTPAAEFKADSGDRTGPERYAVALWIAAERMLDFEYRSPTRDRQRPALGESRY